jgi:hypothetical protein
VLIAERYMNDSSSGKGSKLLAARRSFLVRLDGEVLERLRSWADEDLRSINQQIEFLLRRALAQEGRWRREEDTEQEEFPKGERRHGP